ncbi:40S ribosomal protein S23 [Musa troglodytarum]|uniref:40S ribosomal protein S23 n=1 Tax=Musa troglodytarum TaxID=320322 RepID=A0A9E7H977_9LILI|nr:40S ribosomal protein S23 [Musa troglodytarum]
MGAGRKLKTHRRRRQRRADKAYKKSRLGNECRFFACQWYCRLTSSCRGIEAKQPNSADKEWPLNLHRRKRKALFSQDEVLIAGFGWKGHADGGGRKVSGASLFKEKGEASRC